MLKSLGEWRAEDPFCEVRPLIHSESIDINIKAIILLSIEHLSLDCY